jgi:hypothetical protein
MPYTPFTTIAPKINRQFSQLQGKILRSAEMIQNGFLFVYEDSAERLELRLLPTVYTQGKNIVDPINDMTVLMQIMRKPLGAGADDPGEVLESIEVAYSSWFGEDFL